MKIKLMIDGQEKTFDTGVQTADAIFRAAEFEEEWKQEKTSIGQIRSMTNYVIEMYGNQFTEEDIRNGLTANEFREEMYNQCFNVGREIAEKSKND